MLAKPAKDRFFEDYAAGEVYEFGSIALDETEIVEFGRRYDPQYLHVDPERAARGPYGGLIASGWQTMATAMRLFVDHFLPEEANMGSPGVDELRWLAPVRPGRRSTHSRYGDFGELHAETLRPLLAFAAARYFDARFFVQDADGQDDGREDE